jgi:hypothetical protein
VSANAFTGHELETLPSGREKCTGRGLFVIALKAASQRLQSSDIGNGGWVISLT